MPPRPFSIRIFLHDGSPDGLRIIEKSNWTGIGIAALVGPRDRRKSALITLEQLLELGFLVCSRHAADCYDKAFMELVLRDRQDGT